MTKIVQYAWENLANTLRLYVESHLRFSELFAVDRHDAVTGQDRAFEAKLEKFHTLYDVTKDLPDFDYFKHADTSLLIVLRNAQHHRDHSLFVSWEAFVLAHEDSKKLPSGRYLFASTTPESEPMVVRYYLPLDDFKQRLVTIKNGAAIGALWDIELRFSDVTQMRIREDFNVTSVYVDVMPAFISAMHRVRGWLAVAGFTPSGGDGRIYFQSFGEPAPVQLLAYRAINAPSY